MKNIFLDSFLTFHVFQSHVIPQNYEINSDLNTAAQIKKKRRVIGNRLTIPEYNKFLLLRWHVITISTLILRRFDTLNP